MGRGYSPTERRAYYLAHKEQERTAHVRWRRANQEKEKRYFDNWRKGSPIAYKRSLFKTSIKKMYGLTIDDWDRMLIEQFGRCGNPACGVSLTGRKEPHVDHVHVDGFAQMPLEEKRKFVRGLLCHRCNSGIGDFKDDSGLLRGAAEYLESRTPCVRSTG